MVGGGRHGGVGRCLAPRLFARGLSTVLVDRALGSWMEYCALARGCMFVDRRPLPLPRVAKSRLLTKLMLIPAPRASMANHDYRSGGSAYASQVIPGLNTAFNLHANYDQWGVSLMLCLCRPPSFLASFSSSSHLSPLHCTPVLFVAPSSSSFRPRPRPLPMVNLH